MAVEWLTPTITGMFTVAVAVIEARAARERKKDKEQRAEETKQKERLDAMEHGVQALLRDRIIERYNHYSELGHIPIYGMENVLTMYKAYHKLGGNGTVTKLVEALQELPTDPQTI